LQTAVLAILIFGLLIFVHEFGHFIVAKLVGIRVEEFSIGMGPKAFSIKKGETAYSIRLLPVGGYVKMSGETGFEEESNLLPDDPKNFNNKPIAHRAGVIVAGPLMNFFLAVVLFALVFSLVGVPFASTKIGNLVENGPAEKAGLLPGDRIVAIEGQKVSEWSQMVEIIHNRSGEQLNFTIIRDGQEKLFKITPKLDPESQVGLIGIVQSEDEIKWRKANPIKALIMGFNRTIEILVFVVSAFGQMITGKMTAGEVAGPVGIIQLIGETAQVGLIYVVNLTALISIHLGLLNLFPIPALDGSKLIFLSIEALRGKPINARKENFVHLIGFALLMLIMLIVTYRDIIRIFG